MKKMMAGALVTMLALAGPWTLAAARANDATPAMSDAHAAMDCSTADSTMMAMSQPAKAGEMASGTAMTSGSVDQNYAGAMHAMMGHAMQMAKLEAACGKDARTRALAQKMLEDLQDYAQRLQMREREGY